MLLRGRLGAQIRALLPMSDGPRARERSGVAAALCQHCASTVAASPRYRSGAAAVATP